MAAFACVVGLAVSGCLSGVSIEVGGPSVTSRPSPTGGSTADASHPVYEFVYHTPGESLTLLLQIEGLMVRAAKLNGKANEVAQNDACDLLGKTIEGVGGSVWHGLAITEVGWAGHYCWSDPPESLKHLRVVIDALESAGVTPEPAPELTS